MIDHGIYPWRYKHPDGRPRQVPKNLDEIHAELTAARASLSLSPSQSRDAFERFLDMAASPSEGSLTRNIIPLLTGESDILNSGGLPFANIDSMTVETTVKAVPDFFDGVRAEHIDPQIRHLQMEGNINTLIVPTIHAGVPLLPNFFLELKAHNTEASPAVAVREALHDGAIGARAMHALQNYCVEEPEFDGNAYTYSAVYIASVGLLALYAHHPTPPPAPGGTAEYHMTQVKGFSLTVDHDMFVQGLAAFRNARDLARKHRDRFIQAANARARQSTAEVSPRRCHSR
jgi:hypothetical protein